MYHFLEKILLSLVTVHERENAMVVTMHINIRQPDILVEENFSNFSKNQMFDIFSPF
jgi:hypothetical protein